MPEYNKEVLYYAANSSLKWKLKRKQIFLPLLLKTGHKKKNLEYRCFLKRKIDHSRTPPAHSSFATPISRWNEERDFFSIIFFIKR